MKYQLNHQMTLEKLNPKDKEHLRLLFLMETSHGMEYLTDFDDIFADTSYLEDKDSISAPYAVRIGSEVIGFLKIYDAVEKVIELEYGVLPEYRRRPEHYGSMILKEAKGFVFQNKEQINQIKLSIDPSNLPSQKAAVKALYKKTTGICYVATR